MGVVLLQRWEGRGGQFIHTKKGSNPTPQHTQYRLAYVVDAEHEAQALLHQAGVSCPQPVLNLQAMDKSLEKIYQTPNKQWQENNGKAKLLRGQPEISMFSQVYKIYIFSRIRITDKIC